MALEWAKSDAYEGGLYAYDQLNDVGWVITKPQHKRIGMATLYLETYTPDHGLLAERRIGQFRTVKDAKRWVEVSSPNLFHETE